MGGADMLNDKTVVGLDRSEEHTSELQSPCNFVFRLLLEKTRAAIGIAPSHTGHRARSCGKDLIKQLIGVGAACPNPQIEASFIFFYSTATNDVSHPPSASRPTAF